MSNSVNPTKVVTGKVRFCYVNAFTAVAMEEGDKPKYSVCVIIDKNDTATLNKVMAAIDAAKELGKGMLADKSGKIPTNIKLPLRDGDIERADDPAFANSFFMNASSVRRPGVVDASLEPIIEQGEFYSGCYGRASVNFYAFNVRTKGIACGLNNLQKLEDGEPLAGGSTPEEDFGNDLM